MNGRVVEFSRSAHRRAQELLPWYLTGKLDEDQRLALEAHLRTCSSCQQELHWEGELRDACAGVPTSDAAAARDVELGLAQLQRRLDEPVGWLQGLRRRLPMARWRQVDVSPRWLGYAALAQLGVIGLLISVVVERGGMPAPYRTLGTASDAGTPAVKILVVFDPNLREQDLERMLHAAGARIVGGPNEAGAYLLAVDPVTQASSLRQLRANKSVRMAQVLQGDPPP